MVSQARRGGDENGGDPEPNGFGTTGTFGVSQSAKGTIEAMLPQVLPAQRAELHKRITLWLARNSRPLTLPEHDTEFRDVFDAIFRGGYTPPTSQYMLKLSVEGKEKVVMRYLANLFEEGEFREDVVEGDGLGTVAENVHCTVSENASNIVSCWNCFDGHECADHTAIALLAKVFLEHATIALVFKKLRGMTTHFNHSVI
ncbi:hypothetical protein CYMTET_23336 [Cymbomonas tetramitiformis]|uniref:Uncharacterized protein n=1 Tax=Cymbomonas tetramitiformis TaxID=36881 RepID=A0AAE0L172_9CHLO|nr:hypothetical protein CYMTET_23336 [Cymbomonas tetramitiformis]